MIIYIYMFIIIEYITTSIVIYWWFQPLWNILISWDYHSQWKNKTRSILYPTCSISLFHNKKCSKPPTSILSNYIQFPVQALWPCSARLSSRASGSNGVAFSYVAFRIGKRAENHRNIWESHGKPIGFNHGKMENSWHFEWPKYGNFWVPNIGSTREVSFVAPDLKNIP